MEIVISVHGSNEQKELPELVKVINKQLERGICKLTISDYY